MSEELHMGDVVQGRLPQSIDEKIDELKAKKAEIEKQAKLDAENDIKFEAAKKTAAEKVRLELLENFKRAVGKATPHPLNIPCPACMHRNQPSAMDVCIQHPDATKMPYHTSVSIGVPVVLLRPHSTEKGLLICPVCGHVTYVF